MSKRAKPSQTSVAADGPFADLKYLTGFNNEFASEDARCPGSLPVGQV